jgi:hypothetical protein
MNVSPISSASVLQSHYQAPTPAPKPAALPTDTVTLSSGTQKPPAAGDVDHDGDSH